MLISLATANPGVRKLLPMPTLIILKLIMVTDTDTDTEADFNVLESDT